MTTIYDFGTAEGEMVSLDDYKKARRFSRLWKISAKAWKHAESAKSGFAEMWHGRAIELQSAVIGRDKTIEDLRAQLAAREQDFRTQNTLLAKIAELKRRNEELEKSKLDEVARQEYTDCVLSAGHTDHEIDTVYLRFEREGEEPTTIYLRPDEALSVIWLLSGCLWSAEIAVQHREEEKS